MTLELREKGGIRNGKEALDTEGEGRSYVTGSKACTDHSIMPHENLLWDVSTPSERSGGSGPLPNER